MSFASARRRDAAKSSAHTATPHGAERGGQLWKSISVVVSKGIPPKKIAIVDG